MIEIVAKKDCGETEALEPAGLAAWLLTHLGGPFRMRLGRIAQGRAERRMKLVESLSLGGKRQLMLVTCDGQSFLVGCCGEGVATPVLIPATRSQDPRAGIEREL